MKRSREAELFDSLFAKFVNSDYRGFTFLLWLADQATAGDSEADEYLGLVNQK